MQVMKLEKTKPVGNGLEITIMVCLRLKTLLGTCHLRLAACWAPTWKRRSTWNGDTPKSEDLSAGIPMYTCSCRRLQIKVLVLTWRSSWGQKTASFQFFTQGTSTPQTKSSQGRWGRSSCLIQWPGHAVLQFQDLRINAEEILCSSTH